MLCFAFLLLSHFTVKLESSFLTKYPLSLFFLSFVGIHHWWPKKRCLSFLSRILYGSLPIGRAENNILESNFHLINKYDFKYWTMTELFCCFHFSNFCSLFCFYFLFLFFLLFLLLFSAFQVTTVDMHKPPPNFRSKYDSTPPPILVDGNLVILENEKIERYIMKNVPGGYNLFISDKDTATVIENLYSVSWLSFTLSSHELIIINAFSFFFAFFVQT